MLYPLSYGCVISNRLVYQPARCGQVGSAWTAWLIKFVDDAPDWVPDHPTYFAKLPMPANVASEWAKNIPMNLAWALAESWNRMVRITRLTPEDGTSLRRRWAIAQRTADGSPEKPAKAK